MNETAVLFQGVTMDFRRIFAESEQVRNTVQHLQDIWQKRNVCDLDIMRICAEQHYPPEEKTMYEQPTIFTVSLAKLWELEKNCAPDIFLGHSFGEYAAACAAGVYTPEDGIRLTKFRGQLAYEVNREHPGLMAAINGQIHLSMPRIEQVCKNYSVDIAGINSPEQLVISGEYKPIENACKEMEREGLKVIPLETGSPFHSRHFAPKQPLLRRFLDTIQFRPPRQNLLMNATCKPEADPKKIKDCLVAQLTNPVDFPTVIHAMEALGADADKIQEIGSRNILKGFIKKILRRP